MKLFLWNAAKGAYRVLVWLGVMRLLALAMRMPAHSGVGGDECLKEGFLPLPVHYYSPVPDIKDLKARRVWDVKSTLPGIAFRADEQLELIAELGRQYRDECDWPLRATSDPAEFHLDNQSFSFGCAASTHCIIRRFKPMLIVEIGSGFSSRVISRALALNGGQCGYTVIDPYPGKLITGGHLRNTALIAQKVEMQDISTFTALNSGDILFIDSGHTVKTGGDVNYLFLEVLPRLAPGVIVHIHDIALPYEYPQRYATLETARYLWTEQYLLQAFLCNNPAYEIMLAMNYIQTDHAGNFVAAYPNFGKLAQPAISGSFWMRRTAYCAP